MLRWRILRSTWNDDDVTRHEWLQIATKHLDIVAILPFHHNDPFDRLIVAQALSENIPIVSADPQLDPYGVTRLW
jgi:PIN domain nuclease of toxin-antitoxin system